MNPFALNGKVVLITGASSGIGRAVAKMAASMGATCVINGRDEGRLNETLQSMEGSHSAFAGELAPEFIASLVKNAVRERGAIGGFVHCAGIVKTLPFRSTEISDLREMMGVNLEAFWLLTQAILKRGNFAQGLSVVGIGSIASERGAPGKTAYSASKGALISLIRALAAEYARQKFRFNSITLSFVRTPMFDAARALYEDEEKFNKALLSPYPLGVGEPEDVAAAAAYLLSDAARWVTGSVFSIDGGCSAV